MGTNTRAYKAWTPTFKLLRSDRNWVVESIAQESLWRCFADTGAKQCCYVIFCRHRQAFRTYDGEGGESSHGNGRLT